jgi:hypothetical protein
MGKVIEGKFPLSKPIVSAVSDLESQIGRDQWDRPLILRLDHEPHAGACSTKRGGCYIAHRRASTVAEALEDHFGLDQWKRRLTAEGLAKRPDLVQAIHTASKKEVGVICETAFEFAGGDAASRNGTTMHALTEKLDNGQDIPGGLPANIVAMLEAYEETTKPLTILDTERFVVQDKIKVAGTYDRRVEFEGRILIGDLKTGQSLSYMAVKAPAQVAVYAAGKWYTLDGEREDHGAEKDWGLIIHLPWTEDPKQATCELRWLDLRVGRKAIMEAIRVNDFRKLTYEQTMPRVK